MAADVSGFRWPDGKRLALSITFDDARLSQVDRGVPLLNHYNLRGTFFVSPKTMMERLVAWKSALADGHEIGNHTGSHPCSGNFPFSRTNALEDYTLDALEADIVGANESIRRELGVLPRTFAYPCGQKFVGRGESLESYIPLIARHFLIGRSAFDETHNDPSFVDLAQITGIDVDEVDFETVERMIDRARADGGWLVLFGHEVGKSGRQTVREETLARLGELLGRPENDIWCDTVLSIGSHVIAERSNEATRAKT